MVRFLNNIKIYNMSKIFIINSLFLIITFSTASAQCYIQYTYDPSGNRVKREYVGGCAKPSPVTDVSQPKVDTIVALSTDFRSDLVRMDMDGKIQCYPNPTLDVINIRLESVNNDWNYSITSGAGQIIRKSNVKDANFSIDMSNLSPMPYVFIIRDEHDKIVYKTKIIKQ